MNADRVIQVLPSPTSHQPISHLSPKASKPASVSPHSTLSSPSIQVYSHTTTAETCPSTPSTSASVSPQTRPSAASTKPQSTPARPQRLSRSPTTTTSIAHMVVMIPTTSVLLDSQVVPSHPATPMATLTCPTSASMVRTWASLTATRTLCVMLAILRLCS